LDDEDEQELEQALQLVSASFLLKSFLKLNERDQIHFLKIQVSELRKTLRYEQQLRENTYRNVE
jgi:hypothetical protein